MATMYSAISAATIITAVALIAGARVPTWWQRPLTLIGLAFFVSASLSYASTALTAYDFESFWQFGTVLRAGGSATDFLARAPLPPLNPPSAYPLFYMFAHLPPRQSLIVWTAISVLLCVLLVPLCRWSLADRGLPFGRRCDIWDLGLITAAFAVSNGPRSMIQSGQIAVVAALGLIAALKAQSVGNAKWAGVWLFLGTVKVNTAVPFLPLFWRRRDAWTWIVLVSLVVLVLNCLGWLIDPFRYAMIYAQLVRTHASVGAVNDFTFSGPQTAGMIGLDYALFRLGLRSDVSASVGQVIVLVALALTLYGRRVSQAVAVSHGSQCALIALYAAVCFYHRTQDLVILALPLTYTAIRAPEVVGQARWAYAGAATAILIALVHQRKAVEMVESAIKARTDIVALATQAIVLPYATWLILLAMSLIALGEHLVDRDDRNDGREGHIVRVPPRKRPTGHHSA